MKTCPGCGVKMPDMFQVCPRDGKDLVPFRAGAPIVEPGLSGDAQSQPSQNDALGQEHTAQSDELQRQTAVLSAAEEFHQKTIDEFPVLPKDSLLDNRYRIVDLLGMGGMGTVYKAEHVVLNKTCAIKLVHPQRFDQESLQRFKLEAKATSMLQHPNIVGIHDYGVNEGFLPYIVMEYLDGKSLEYTIQEHGPLAPQRFLNIFEQVCDGLSHAHKHGVIHRDLKPANIFICAEDGQSDRVKIVDFGIAKLIPQQEGQEITRITLTGEVIGSPLYMSPEQCSGGNLDARSDIYSLGIMMHEVLTGQCVFDGTPTQVMRAQILEAPELRDYRMRLSEDMKEIILKCLRKDPTERYQNIDELKEKLHDLTSS